MNTKVQPSHEVCLASTTAREGRNAAMDKRVELQPWGYPWDGMSGRRTNRGSSQTVRSASVVARMATVVAAVAAMRNCRGQDPQTNLASQRRHRGEGEEAVPEDSGLVGIARWDRRWMRMAVGTDMGIAGSRMKTNGLV